MKSTCNYFEDIMRIPRESGKEERIAKYIINYAKENNIEYKLGKYNTVLLRKNNNSDRTHNLTSTFRYGMCFNNGF